MGRYIEQLKNFKTRGVGTAKPTQPPAKTNEVMTVLAPGYPLVSKILQVRKDILACRTVAEYFAVMRDFRATNPTEEEICEVYRVAGLKLAVIKGGGTHISNELTRRTAYQPDRSPEAVASAPLSISQARALKRKYAATGDVWERFWIWAGVQIERGANADFIRESEWALVQAHEKHATNTTE